MAKLLEMVHSKVNTLAQKQLTWEKYSTAAVSDLGILEKLACKPLSTNSIEASDGQLTDSKRANFKAPNDFLLFI